MGLIKNLSGAGLRAKVLPAKRPYVPVGKFRLWFNYRGYDVSD